MRWLRGQESSRHGFGDNHQEFEVKASSVLATACGLYHPLDGVQFGVILSGWS